MRSNPFLAPQAPWTDRWKRLLGQERLAAIAPLAAVLLFLATIAAAFWYLSAQDAQRELAAARHDLEFSQQQLRLHLQEQAGELERLARAVSGGNMGAAQFAQSARALVGRWPEMRDMRWLDAQGRTVARLPPEGSAAGFAGPQSEGADDSGNANELGQAGQMHGEPYAVPLPAGAGKTGSLRVYVPLMNEGRLEGALLIVYDASQLLHHGLPQRLQEKYAFSLLDETGGVLAGLASAGGRPQADEGWPWADRRSQARSLPLALPWAGGALTLQAQVWRAPEGVVGRALFWLAAALSAMTVWMLVVNWRFVRWRQQAQAALTAETSFRRAMENSMRTGMRALDLHGRITYVNPAFCRMTGWSEAELVGQMPPYSYWPEQEHQTLMRVLADELAGRAQAASRQIRVRRKSGELFDARLYIAPLMDGHGQHSGWVASMTDISEPNRVRAELAAARERFTLVLESLEASVSVAPLGSKELLFANKRYRRWFGDTTQGHLGMVISASSLRTAPGDSGEKMRPDNAEIYLPPLDKWLDVRSRYLTWADGRLAQMVIATDVTARRAAEARAEEQARLAEDASRLITMGEMASSVAHELNQPLTAISNYCTGIISRVQAGGLAQEDLLGALRKTARQAQRAGQVIQHIRNFVKRSDPKMQLGTVAAIIEPVLELAEVEARRRQVRLGSNVAPNLPQVLADPILIGQVLLNLIRNAAESIEAAQRPPDERRITLLASLILIEDQSAVQFAVEDTGCGLPPGVQERLYEAFFSTKREGMGIGLNLCRSIIEAHQGRLRAVNLYNGGQTVGCRFSFWIPAAAAAAPAQARPLNPEET